MLDATALQSHEDRIQIKRDLLGPEVLNVVACEGAERSQRTLGQLVKRFLRHPQVLSSTPRGSEFQAEVKKIPSSVPITKALGGHRPNSHLGDGKPPCKGGGGGSGIFLTG